MHNLNDRKNVVVGIKRSRSDIVRIIFINFTWNAISSKTFATSHFFIQSNSKFCYVDLCIIKRM